MPPSSLVTISDASPKVRCAMERMIVSTIQMNVYAVSRRTEFEVYHCLIFAVLISHYACSLFLCQKKRVSLVDPLSFLAITSDASEMIRHVTVMMIAETVQMSETAVSSVHVLSRPQTPLLGSAWRALCCGIDAKPSLPLAP